MKNRKKLLASLLAFGMILSVSACGDPSAAPVESKTPPSQAVTESKAPAGDENGTASTPAEFDGKVHGPFVMTTCGQSTGSVMLHMVAGQIGATSTDDHELSADTFEPGDAKTLIVTTGTSGKGMGAAGTDVNDEIERCTAVIEAAKEAGMTIVCAHVEGMARRTDANDQASIDAILPLADVIMVVEESDSDGLFSNYATEHDIPIITSKDALGMGDYMAAE
ncbi:MAG: hypothetical protein KH704_08100 [Clostridiales bacterium]|nr:hypothetical protein [Clostridiales bacterium]